MRFLGVFLLVGFAVVVGCGSDANRDAGAGPPPPLPVSSGPATAMPDPPPATSATDEPVTTVDVGPPSTTPRTTVTITSPPPVPVGKRAQLEQRAAEFELLDPSRDPARYLAMSTRECRGLASEQAVRESGTARPGGFLSEAEARRLDLVEGGTPRIVGIEIVGDARTSAVVEVRLNGDPPTNSPPSRQWILEDGNWQVGSCLS